MTELSALSWFGIFRMGLIQTALGSIVVLTTSTINRIMVVELSYAALLPGALVAWHYALQFLRPRWGYGSDGGSRRTPWIIFGLGILGLGGTGSALSVALLGTNFWIGLGLAIFSFTLVGIGVGAAGTSLLALLATHVAPSRRAPAATIVWMMMISGFIVTTLLAGHYLDPFSMTRLVGVTTSIACVAFLVGTLAVWGIEPANPFPKVSQHSQTLSKPREASFSVALRKVWEDLQVRRFTIFVFVSMLAYSMQDLILEPFAGLAFSLTPGQSTKLSGYQNMGVLLGMLVVAICGSSYVKIGSLKAWTIGGCLASAIALLGLVLAGLFAPHWPLSLTVIGLGFANGAFAVAAIGCMMGLAGSGEENREGMRMGIWGAAQATAFGAGGFVGAAMADCVRQFLSDPSDAYTLVFAAEAVLFIGAAILGARAIVEPSQNSAMHPLRPLNHKIFQMTEHTNITKPVPIPASQV